MREFDLGVILTGTDGHLLCDFADFQEMVEHLFGHPVWTHELAMRADEIKDELLKQHPDLAGVEFVRPDIQDKRSMQEYIKYWLESLEPEYGKSRVVESLSQERTESPLATLTSMLDRPGGV